MDIQYHPWCQQPDIVKKSQENDILIEGYCPIVRGKKEEDPVCINLKNKHPGKPVSQILLRWAVQKGTVPLPKSDTPSRIKSK